MLITSGAGDRAQKFKDLAELDAHVTGLLSFAHMVEPDWAEKQLTDGKRLAGFPSGTRNR